MISNALSVHHSAIELAAKTGPVGPSVIDVAKLYAQTGILAYSAAHRIVACFDLAVALDFIATLIMIAGGSIVVVAAAAFGGTVTTGFTPTQSRTIANGAVVGALIMAMGMALTSLTI